MKNLLLTASAIAAIAAPALSMAQGYQQPANPPTVVRDQRQAQRQQDNRQAVRQDMRERVWNRNDRNWWRGRSDFAGYAGVRSGFWFVPGRGYIRPDPRWYGFSWRVGGLVPFEFRNYYVANPYVYGLSPPPPAYRYVYLGRNIALIAIDSGRIVRVIPNVYF